MTPMLLRRLRPATAFVLTLLLIEFLDELIFGAGEAAWPLIRDDLALNYAQIGLLLTLPKLVGNLVEPVIGVLGDVWKRRVLILGGGAVFTVSLLLIASSQNFWMLLLSLVLVNPASGAFVGLSQSTLMDVDPKRHEQNMARWTFAGSVGVVCGPLLLGLLVSAGPGWRGTYLATAVLALALLVVSWRFTFNGGAPVKDGAVERISLKDGFRNALLALKRREVLRWLALLEFSDLLLDVLYSYLALYFVDVVGVEAEQAALAVAVWTGVGLLGDLLLIPLLERVRGLTYLRISALLEFVLYTAFLLIPGVAPKLVVAGLLGFFNSGWYSILKGQLYSAMPGQSGSVITVGNLFGLVASLIPLGLGLAAQQLGLSAAMWLLLAGPAALLVGIPRQNQSGAGEGVENGRGS